MKYDRCIDFSTIRGIILNMKFLLDQDVYTTTMRFLRDLGHDVVLVAQIGLSQADDSDYSRKLKSKAGYLLHGTEILAGLFL